MRRVPHGYLRSMRKILFVLFIGLSGAQAQSYPEFQQTTVNDYAELLPEAEEAALHARLSRLRADTGVEMTVLTLASQAPFSDDTLEGFARGLFDHWGIGDAARNDGVLVLILADDRAMRIELGAAYGRDWDWVAGEVIEGHFVEAFAAGDYPGGIRRGTTAVIEEIVMPFREGAEAPARDRDIAGFFLFTGVLLVIVATVAKNALADAFVRLKRCPSCGQRGLTQTHEVRRDATFAAAGEGNRQRRCSYCDFSEDHLYIIPRLAQNGQGRSGGGGFGGGHSGGGGASGRW